MPKSVTASATTDAEIETALIAYASTVVTNRGTWSDTWYAMDGSTLVTADTAGLTEAQKALNNGCGLTYNEYYEKKSTMLQSIKANGGFYIGKYEVGYELAEGESVRSFGEEYDIEHPTTQTPVIKQDAYPYNWVRCYQAEGLADSLATGGKTSSLMFGIQWDLVLKYLNVKNVKTIAELTSDSSSWGNYYDAVLNITSNNAKQSTDYGGTYTTITGTKPANNGIILTTGASNDTGILNIYDLAGNMAELTLENTSYSFGPCASRGGVYNVNGSNFTASNRCIGKSTDDYAYDGFRPSLY